MMPNQSPELTAVADAMATHAASRRWLSFGRQAAYVMWGKGPPKNNAESWQDIQLFIAEFPDDDYWSKWKPMVHDVVAKLEARDMVPLFRVGQSMHHVLFSTLDHHQLTSEPRVTLEFHPKEQTVRVTYSCSNLWFNEPISQDTIQIADAMPSILCYLRRLWSETKPATPIPDGLNAA